MFLIMSVSCAESIKRELKLALDGVLVFLYIKVQQWRRSGRGELEKKNQIPTTETRNQFVALSVHKELVFCCIHKMIFSLICCV